MTNEDQNIVMSLEDYKSLVVYLNNLELLVAKAKPFIIDAKTNQQIPKIWEFEILEPESTIN